MHHYGVRFHRTYYQNVYNSYYFKLPLDTQRFLRKIGGAPIG